MLKVYCARPINGCTPEEVQLYYRDLEFLLSPIFTVLTPLSESEYVRTDTHFKSEGNGQPTQTNKVITRRDRWLVKQSDIVFVNLLNAKSVSIGCVAELSWGYDNGKHTIVVMEDGNPHQHAFIKESADAIFTSLDEAINYLKVLNRHFGGEVK